MVAAVALPLAACGSSKPSYCSDKSTLKSEIQNLPNQLQSEGIGSLQSNLKKIETDAQTVVKSAKSDFPSETQAMQSSVNTLKAGIQALGSSPSPQDLVALLPQAKSVASSVTAFDKAASSKC